MAVTCDHACGKKSQVLGSLIASMNCGRLNRFCSTPEWLEAIRRTACARSSLVRKCAKMGLFGKRSETRMVVVPVVTAGISG